MPVPFLAALLAVPPAIAAPAAHDAASVRVFLQSIYAGYRKGGRGARLGQPELYFEPVLARAIRKDAAAAAAVGDQGKMDADPFCACQDFDAIAPAYGPVTIKGDRATVTVRFGLFDSRIALNYSLVWTRAGWRVFDITGSESGSLRAIYLS
ncbi:YbjP/YqhG family protein [Sphingomonas sp. LB-2]|uniref:YbjP/YqhG family protein n=1 Tax=Sphingomonas caeni TaxID=2984949 RepID=UPI00223269EA|nr:YbjP/YqhG family protein [Sphingomonas caeni]MCW3846747.1 YbjP/YqhG family protein [Sphingomonas caeni]